jgi:hypothetical protein
MAIAPTNVRYWGQSGHSPFLTYSGHSLHQRRAHMVVMRKGSLPLVAANARAVWHIRRDPAPLYPQKADIR